MRRWVQRRAACYRRVRWMAELAGQNGEMDVSDQIDEVVREIQAGE